MAGNEWLPRAHARSGLSVCPYEPISPVQSLKLRYGIAIRRSTPCGLLWLVVATNWMAVKSASWLVVGFL